MIAPLLVLCAVGLLFGWLLRTARTTSEDVVDLEKGATAGQHLPSLHPDVRDAVVPRTAAVDAETERFRNSLPGGGASGG